MTTRKAKTNRSIDGFLRSIAIRQILLKVIYPIVLFAVLGSAFATAQQALVPNAQAAAAAPIERRDPELEAAANEIGRALFLRCFCADDHPGFDARGSLMVNGKAKIVDWTLAAINVQKVERKDPRTIELDGVRVAIRYAADRHEFERHPQKDEEMRITIADTGDPVAFEKALHAVFATGIDRPLQKAMPDYWQHYFEPGLPWPSGSPDALTGVTMYNPGAQVPASSSYLSPSAGSGIVSAPVATHKADGSYTSYAAHDRIRGSVRMRMVVDAGGTPRRISVAIPLGYGLDEEAVKAAAKIRFSPAMLNGQPVAANVVIEQEFVLTPPAPSR